MKITRQPLILSLLGLVDLARCGVLPNWNSYPSHDPAIENRTLDEIYASAKHEMGDLIVLWGGDAVSQGVPTIAAWQARFPEIKLNLTVDVSKYHDSRVNRQFQRNGTDGADIAVLQTLHDFGRWKREGRLLPYKPLKWEDIYSAIKDPHGAFVGAYICEHPDDILSLRRLCPMLTFSILRQLDQFGDLIYNTGLLNESSVPSSYGEFVRPEWKSKLALTYPNDDDAITYLFSVIIDKYGWDWFESLLEQDVQWVRGTGEPADYVAEVNSTRSLSFTTNLNTATNLASKAPEDARLLWPQTGAIFASTPRPESAKLFMSWLLSDEYQEQFVNSQTYLARKDLPSKLGNVWDDEFTALTQFATFMENRDLVEWWRLQFETSIGTAQGLSPVLSYYGSR
ncbi:ABC-type Fe3+ transport system [Penicillium digitatum PHI26]|uniref:ABC-type Fe3+ transport system n=2 Tax=Penicillium digitatum TaxID=36651 RepID=K9FRJ3_PEND2|nr:ABC-type Fe3+ transport system [Penicillium digitatum Pd1]EKV11061.1 ABC-type Fe3+ transport system [Penicillium digitatum Pd1]EKV11784.1 ABC-type Fe3+ transport system [Penicillium digitatum PHI26]